MTTPTIRYPDYALELRELLAMDQQEKLTLASRFLKDNTTDYTAERAELKESTTQRTKRMMEILSIIGTPSLSNIGDAGALAVSVLASHDSAGSLKRVLQLFEDLYRVDPSDCRYQSIPAMYDSLAIAERRPQRYGTHWFFDANNYPFLYPVEDCDHIAERRAAYGIEAFRWPKSLAMPLSRQPWLKKPLQELVMREPTEEEYRLNQAY